MHPSRKRRRKRHTTIVNDIGLSVFDILSRFEKFKLDKWLLDKIQFVKGLPKTRSGKIMRRILRKIAEGETQNLGDITTLLDPGIVEEIKNGRI